MLLLQMCVKAMADRGEKPEKGLKVPLSASGSLARLALYQVTKDLIKG